MDRDTTAAQVILELFRLDGVRTLEGDLVSLVADVEFGDVALFGEFDALFIREFSETPEHTTPTFAAVVEAVAASLLLAIANGEVRLPAERLNSLFDHGLGLVGIFLVGGDCRSGTDSLG